MKKKIIVLFALVLANSLYASWPMESVDRYNIVLVHGAADRWQGLDCENGDPKAGERDYEETYNTREGVVTDPSTCHPDSVPVPDANNPGAYRDSVFTKCDTAYYNPVRIGGVKMPSGNVGGTAVGMIKELFSFLNNVILETPNAAYLQRPFVHPAGSPALNGNEIGQSNWKGENRCSARRSLIEEAQEFKAHGQDSLKIFRENTINEYRKIPSRNILVGHSMGGVAIREYVQGPNYNKDVDKFITLDSPHEGTGALNLLLDLDRFRYQIGNSFSSGAYSALVAGMIAYIAMGKNPAVLDPFLMALSVGMVGGTLQQVVKEIAWNSYFEDNGFDYRLDDALVEYINPENGNAGINGLKDRDIDESFFPMARILGAKNSMTFTDPDASYRKIMNYFIPEAFDVPLLNASYQLFGDGPMTTRFVNAETSFALGYIVGITLQDNGSALIPTESGLAKNTAALMDGNLDVVRELYNAAVNVENGDQRVFADVFTITGVALLVTEAALRMWCSPCTDAAKTAIGITGALSLSTGIIEGVTAGTLDLIQSHDIPTKSYFHQTHFGNENTYSKVKNENELVKPLLMEDFLYEKPFVNLALSLSDSALRSVDPGCYYEADDANKQHFCEVGLYGSRDSIVVNTHVVVDSTGSGKDSVWYDTTHFHNAVTEKLDSIGNVVRDSSGNVVYDSVYYGTFEQRNYSEFRKSPLKFRSESDWYKVGVKVDRWERVDGLNPNGDSVAKYVPIRHVERYSVPDIVVTGFIEKYSFVVDDLMPHRMRQIKMTFNSNEEVAWECDISKAEDDPHACAVYKRLLGNSWGKPDTTIGDKGYVPHPIKKNGRFDFNARDYFDNLANIQKDNQNTVMISMVNKIGLSNTQRFYYLFKATANMLKPTWPQHDVVLNEVDGFGVYVSALDYQGFRVRSAKDGIFSDPLGTPTQVGDSLPMVMTEFQGSNAEGKDTSSAVFASKQKISTPAEGKYRWVVDAVVNNSEKDSSKTDSYEVHFVVDRTAPAFTLTSDAMMNPDSSMFITRFKWAGKDSADKANGSDIRAMRWTLEKATGQPSGGSQATFTKYAELPALYDVASNEFAIAWDKVPQGKRDSMGNGLYRIAAHAIDYAVPNLDAYHKVNALVDGIFSNPQDTSVWGGIDSLALNDTTIYAEFRVDHSAPSFTFRETRAVTASDTVNYGTYVNLSGKYDALRANRPARNADWTYISKDSLLQIGYTVMDSLNGLDSAAVTVGWNFVHISDTNVIDRAGDSVWVFDSLGGKSSGTWTEMAGLRMADGEYSVRAVLRDAAKNVHHDSVPKRVRVDRTAPQIVGLTSDHLVYMDKDGDFSATILLSESGDVGVNRTGMHCSYRVLGGADTSWHEIRKGNRKLLANDTVNFTIAKKSVDTARGTRYLEAACVDAAGNVSVRTDLFHVGARFPQITYPQADSVQSEQSFIPIVGIAPKTSSADSLSSVYRLRYRVGNDTAWRTDKVKVVAANRSTSADNVSRISQSTEGVLGYLENDGFGDEAKITVELAIASCETCDDWAATTTNFVVIPPDTNYSKPAVEFAITRNGSDVTTFKTGDGPVDISVRLKNKFNGNYMLRVYAEDSKHRGIFDASSEKVFYNPYYGTPTAAADTAIWFYEKDGKYHLAWKNLDKINLKVGYNSAKFGESCVDSAGNTATGCSTEHAPVNFSAVLDAAKAYLADYPEWMPPAYIDSAMTISDGSGEIVMDAEDAFRVYAERKDPQDTSALNVPVYFGESDKPGFYWVEHVDSLVSPLMTGWTVNPNAYGLDYRWNGIATSGAYPSGDITLYAEVTENILDNPFVNVVSKTLKVEQKDAELIVASSLPDYVLLAKSGPGSSSAGTSDTPVYELDSMRVYFGLKNADAHVRVSIFESDSLIKELLNDTLRAHCGDSVYSIKWVAVDSKGMPLEPGAYYVKFEVNSDTSKTKISTFNLKLRENVSDVTPEDPKTANTPSFFVAEAKKKDDGRYVYEPYADYLVLANMSGWYLPDTLRNKTFNVTGNVLGMQNILGFRPERFSLGIKRHRDTLEMYVVTKFFNETVQLDNCSGGCDFNHESITDYRIDYTIFTEMKRDFTITYDLGYTNKGFDKPKNSYVDVVACTNKTWQDLINQRKKDGRITNAFFNDTLKTICEWNIGKLLGPNKEKYMITDPGRCVEPKWESVAQYLPYSFQEAASECNKPSIRLVYEWVLNPKKERVIDSCMAQFLCPNIEFKEDTLLSRDIDVGCVPDTSKDGYLDLVCDKSDTKYDPNLRLFDVTFTPAENKRFFSDWAYVNSNHAKEYYWTREHFSMTLKIPDSYWNAPFGMDNLVNRTIRFDHTNETIFNGGDDDGYWNAVKGNGRNSNPIDIGANNYFDGYKWTFKKEYGLLTPFEVQKLEFYGIDKYPDGSNVFRFDDESKDYMYSSRFELKFYGHDSTTHHFEAKVIGNLADPLSVDGCETDVSKFVVLPGTDNPCQVRLTSISGDSVKTPVFTHGNVHFFVGMNRLWSETDTKNGISIPYPADSATWRKSIGNICSDSASYTYLKKMAQGDKDSVCYKYYGSGSRVHYYFNDYSDSLWKDRFLEDSLHYFRNYVNSPSRFFAPKSMDSSLAVVKNNLNGMDFSLRFNINSDDFSKDDRDSLSGKFFIRLDSLKKIREEYAGAGIDIQRINVDSVALDANAVYDSSAMILYVNAQRWTDTVVYRRSNDTTKNLLERPGDTISLRDIYVYRANPDANSCGKALYCYDDILLQKGLKRNPWIKDPVVESASIKLIDFTDHPLLVVSGKQDSTDRNVTFKDTDVGRPSELVEIRGNLVPKQTYSLSFLNNSTYYSVVDSLKVDSNCVRYMDGSCHLAWFNVNRLQGHTQFLLTWGESGAGVPTNAMHFNMYVGSNVKPENDGVVKSMFGDLSVTFPKGSIDKAEDFTVRTVNVQKDYGFGIFKNMALTGPVVEVLPSMTFTDTNNLPRIQMRISKKEMENMRVTPQMLRLYKVDFENKQFVPLEDALYGFLHADGSAVMKGKDTLKCDGKTDVDTRCANKDSFDWEYVLISAQTRTFSVFVAMDSLAASMPRIGLEVLPAVAKSSEREVRIDGVSDFSLYVDDDSLWNDDGDLTPMEPLSFTLDMNGIAHVTLPNHLGEIDTNYVFAFAKVNDNDMFAPVVANALTVPAKFACRVPTDLLWMGTDNGYLAYGATCNHPGNGTLSLYMNNSLVAEIRGEIPDTIKYDGKRLVGGSVIGYVPDGLYESRYVGFSELGENLQLVGPTVRTDSARPVIDAFEVLSGEDVLDQVFTVRANVKDIESGIAHVEVSSKLGNAFRAPFVLTPDSLGNVTGVIRLSRSELSKCSGCKLSLELRAEDYGHNHTENTYDSGVLYPYPTELALWFPSREGTGDLAHEYVGTGHDLNLHSVTSPWLGDAGIYFSMPKDRAAGVGRVNLGTSNSYSFETRIKVGYPGVAGWHRVLGFEGVGGLEMELLVNGRKLQLREGTRVWETLNDVLPVAKEWAHVVVTVDSLEVNFYVNGEFVKSDVAEPLERELKGVFSVGDNAGNSFVGNVADIRMYKKALSGVEVFALSLPVSDDNGTEPEIIEIITVPMITVDGGNGFEPEFSCAVAGNRYFESTRDRAKLTMDALIEKTATYKVMMYARSATLQSANVSVSPSFGIGYTGGISVSPVWRTVTVSDISMNLSAGMHTITLEAPEGLQIAGFALVTANVSPASIAWNSGMENLERKVKTFVRYEGFNDKKMLQPRIRLRNISNGQINGYSVRYYFRGEESFMARAHAYYPYDTTGLAVHSESNRTGYVEWSFNNGVIPVAGTVFNGDGPHFGVHYEDWTPWNAYDDPSFVENAATAFVEDDGIIVLDADKRLIGGSCVEMEDSVSAEVKARVFAAEIRNDNQASEVHLKVENVGNVTLKNYEVRYYFFLEGGLAPEFNVYNLPDGVTARMENIGDGRWQVVLHASMPLVSGGSWKDNAQIVLHCENWNDVWNAADDPSRVRFGREMVEAVGVNVFDSLGNRIYGNEPVWPEIVHVATADSSDVPDYGLKPKNDTIPIHRTDDGLVIEMTQYTNVSLSLVNVVGAPVKKLYSGTLSPGQQFIHVDWTGVDLNKTYLMLRVNDKIKSTKLLSLL